MVCDGNMVIELVIMSNVTGDSMDDNSGDEDTKDDDIATVSSADGLIDAQIISLKIKDKG